MKRRTDIASTLSEIPGLGPARVKVLLAHFGSVKKLRAASVDDIAAVPGFGPVLAAAIKDQLDRAPGREAVNTATGEIVSG